MSDKRTESGPSIPEKEHQDASNDGLDFLAMFSKTGSASSSSPNDTRPESSATPSSSSRAQPDTSNLKLQKIDMHLHVGRDKANDWGVLACAPNCVAKTVVNAVSIPIVMACYAVAKLGLMAPTQDTSRGGIENSVAFYVGHRTLMYSNGIVPTIFGEDEDVNSDFRDAPFIVSNHLSYLDGIVLAGMLNFPKIIAKRELSDMPLLGQLLIDLDCVFLDRDSSGSRQKILNLIAEHAETWKAGDRPLLIFPEGTTTNGNAVGTFRKGAFTSGLPVRPVALFYTGRWNPNNPDNRMDGDQVVTYSDGEWALQFFGHMYHSLLVKILPVYTPSDAEKQDPVLYAENVRLYIEKEYFALKDEFAEQQVQNSWKVAAGRESGSLDYEFGDETRVVMNSLYSWLGWDDDGPTPNEHATT